MSSPSEQHPLVAPERGAQAHAMQRTSGRKTFIGIAMIAIGSAFVAAMVPSRQQEPGQTTTPELTEKHVDSSDADAFHYDCVDYDDDTVFTAELCGEFDTIECFDNVTYSDEAFNIVQSCNSSFWCSEFCSDMCNEGMGAVCFYQTMTDLESTCASVADIRDEDTYDTLKRDADTPASPYDLGNGHGENDEMQDYGCGRHSFCEYCSGECRSTKLEKYLEHKYNVTNAYNPSVMKHALIDIVTTCKSMGLQY